MALVFFVNGAKVVEEHPDPDETLLTYIRNVLHLRGSKEGCGRGRCGSCTVMLSSIHRPTKTLRHIAVVACLVPLCGVHGMAVTTIEGIGSTRSKLHPVQESLIRGFGSQCGFCSPGMVMSMYSLLRSTPQPSSTSIRQALHGNLCRCTGYRPILEAFETFSKENVCGMGDKCCKYQEQDQSDAEKDAQFPPLMYDVTQEPIFPPELQLSDALDTDSVCFQSGSVTWHRPATLQELMELINQEPEARVTGGHTMMWASLNESKGGSSVRIATGHLPELQEINMTETGLQLGSSVTIEQLREELVRRIESEPEDDARFFRGLEHILKWFGSRQVRNVVTIGGCINGGYNANDLYVSLLAIGANIDYISKGENKTHVLTEEFVATSQFSGDPCDFVTKVTILRSKQQEYFYTFKQSKRKECDISQLNAAFFLELDGDTIRKARLALSGLGLNVIMLANNTMKALEGREWTEECLHFAQAQLKAEMTERTQCSDYMLAVATGFLSKFFVAVAKQRDVTIPTSLESVVPTCPEDLYITHSRRVLTEAADGQPDIDPLHRPRPHESAYQHATGEAAYVNDLPSADTELFMTFVLSTKAHADIVSIDWQEALAVPGVVAKIDHNDIPGKNQMGILVPDEEVLISKTVTAEGQIIGGVIASSKKIAKFAAKQVKVTYAEKTPIITIQDAIDAKSFLMDPMTISSGDVAQGFRDADKIIEGEMKTGAQDHFYLEPIACVAVPLEKGGMDVFITTQNLVNVQGATAGALGVASHKISCHVKRVGGAFGGKESRAASVAVPVAVAAAKVNRPVRVALEREENMRIIGSRHECIYRYKLGLRVCGGITAADITVHANAGYCADLSPSIMEFMLACLFHSYRITNARAVGYLCRTNVRSSTAFRGYGMVQPMITAEHMLTDAALTLNVPQHKIRERNFYVEGDVSVDKQLIRNWTLKKCWTKVIEQSDYHSLLLQTEQFNKEHRWQKQGVAIIPSSIRIGMPYDFLNTGAALVNIYTDGSVLLKLGGVELGQGLHTKMMQVASHVLGIPLELVNAAETNLASVPNAAPTAASMASDYNGHAVRIACETLLERLEPIRTAKPDDGWQKWVLAAYYSRINLSAVGYYKSPHVGYDSTRGTASVFNYTTQGAAVSHVQIDCLTGHHTVLSTDIVMDVGTSLNPSIDVGQIEGGFMMGYGLYMLEEVEYSPSGTLLTDSVHTYKIPTVGCLPRKFNVTLFTGSGEPRSVYSAKSVGEPPMFLSGSVFFAIKNAITAARAHSKLSNIFPFSTPASAEKVRMLCGE